MGNGLWVSQLKSKKALKKSFLREFNYKNTIFLIKRTPFYRNISIFVRIKQILMGLWIKTRKEM